MFGNIGNIALGGSMLGRGSSPNSTGTNQQTASNPAGAGFGMLNQGQAQPGMAGNLSQLFHGMHPGMQAPTPQPGARGPYGGPGGWTIDPIDSWQQQQPGFGGGGGVGMLKPGGAGSWGGGMIGNIGNLGGGAYRGPANAPAQAPNAQLPGLQARQGGYNFGEGVRPSGIGQMFSQMHPQAQQALHGMNPQVLQQLHQAGMLHPELMGHLNSMRGGGGGMRSPMLAY